MNLKEKINTYSKNSNIYILQKNVNHAFEKNLKHVCKAVSDVYEKCIAYMKKSRHQTIYLQKMFIVYLNFFNAIKTVGIV